MGEEEIRALWTTMDDLKESVAEWTVRCLSAEHERDALRQHYKTLLEELQRLTQGR